jgi:hypothetical protein
MGRFGGLVKKTHVLAALLVVGLFAVSANAQTGDVAFGVSGLKSSYPGSSIVNSGNPYAPSMGGGTYLSFSGDFVPWHQFGFGGEVSWRASQNLYLGYQPYRPIFYDADAVYAPKWGKYFGADLIAGIGAESLRFYNNYYTCSYVSGCTNYTSSNHFMGVFGGGLKIYPKGGFFIRPEVRLYVIHNNVEFSSGTPVRAGVSIGYTFGGGQ